MSLPSKNILKATTISILIIVLFLATLIIKIAAPILATLGNGLWLNKEAGAQLSAPLVYKNTAYVASESRIIYAIDLGTGKQKWSLVDAGWVDPAPHVYKSTIYSLEGSGFLQAIDSMEGYIKNSFTVGLPSLGFNTTPMVANDSVYLLNDYYSGNAIYAFDIKTGKLRWKHRSKDIRGESFMASDGVVCFGDEKGDYYALNPLTGKVTWIIKTGGSITGPPSIDHGIVYLGSEPAYDSDADSKTGLVVVEASSGKIKLRRSSHSVLALSYLEAREGVVCAVDAGRTLCAFTESSGREMWQFATSTGRLAAPAIKNGRVFIEDSSGNVYALSLKTGKELWRFKALAGTHHNPAVGNGVVCVSDYGHLYALDEKTGNIRWTFKVKS